MVGIKELRPLKDMSAPPRVRLEFRQMFKRWLAREDYGRATSVMKGAVDELALLDLCQHYRLEYPGSAKNLPQSWDESAERIADDGPLFAELIRLNWILFDGGRWTMQTVPRHASSYIKFPTPSTKAFLTGLRKPRLIAKTESPPPHAQVLARKILDENWLEQRMPIKDPDWLASRIWEKLCPRPQSCVAENIGYAGEEATSTIVATSYSSANEEVDPDIVDNSFLEWSAWCDIVGDVCAWNPDWSADEMRYCCEAAHRVLERQGLWGTWDNDIECYSDVLLKTFGIPQEELRYVGYPRTPPPKTLIAQVDWLHWPDIEHLMMGRFSRSTVAFAYGLLCSVLEKTDIGLSVAAAAPKVFSFAVEHPMALQQLGFRVDVAPVMLVDMLLHQRTACMASKLIVEWRPNTHAASARNRSREAQTKEFAIQDALSLVAYHLDEGTLENVELASLVTWCYDDGSGHMKEVADSRRLIGPQLLAMLASQKQDFQFAVLRHLVAQAAHIDNVPRARFTGVLEGLVCLSKAPSGDTLPIVTLYSKFARDLHLDWTDASSLPPALAAQLVATAFQQTAVVRDGFLFPFDNAKLLREALGDTKLYLSSSIGKTLRVHVLLLARAVAGWSDEAVPSELSDALVNLVSRTVTEHTEKERIGALTDRYRPGRFSGRGERSPARDLSAAWRRLDDSHQKKMLRVILQSDDPVLLAELCQHIPAAARPDIRERLRDLGPGEASQMWTWPEVFKRIESFLVAGECGLAREHLLEAEHSSLRVPQQFRLSLFGLGLQLLVKEENWNALDNAVIPQDLDERTSRQAEEQLDFFKATSQMLRPDGNLAEALVVLKRLAATPQAASAYKRNELSVALRLLLGPSIELLTGENRIAGEHLLAEINVEVAKDDESMHGSLHVNRGVLLLALHRPEEALESVASCRMEIPSADLEIIAALAKDKMGLHSDAMRILDAAIKEFGDDQRLLSTKNDIQTGRPASNITLANVDVGELSSIRNALYKLIWLPPFQVGELFASSTGGLKGYLIQQVSSAVATLTRMSAMLRDRKRLVNLAKFEDDLNTAVREVLGASLAITHWNVIDQSLGGTTSNGNPGKRDLVIRQSRDEIAVYEALVCNGLNKSTTKQHFDKLLTYGDCEIYFHVTYSYAKKIQPLLKNLEHMLEHEVPPGYSYIESEKLNSVVPGYVGTYSSDRGTVSVVFLIVDLKPQAVLRGDV